MSLPDTIFIFGLALVIFGPKKLPEIGRQMGKLLYEFRRASNEFKLQIEEELRAADEAARENRAAIESAAANLDVPSEVDSTSDVVTSYDTSDASGDLTVRPPATGEQVSTESPASAFSTATQDSASETGSEAEPLIDKDWNEGWDTNQEHGGEGSSGDQNYVETAASEDSHSYSGADYEYRGWDRHRAYYEAHETRLETQPAASSAGANEPFQWECTTESNDSRPDEPTGGMVHDSADFSTPDFTAEEPLNSLDETNKAPIEEEDGERTLTSMAGEPLEPRTDPEPLTTAVEQPVEQAANHHA